MNIESNPINYVRKKGWKYVTCTLIFFEGGTEESGKIRRDDLDNFLFQHRVAYYKSQIVSECGGEKRVRFTVDSENSNNACPKEAAIIIEHIE